MLAQPPSGGCVLKLRLNAGNGLNCEPAAFGRLCVETLIWNIWATLPSSQPPSGGCVLKQSCINLAIQLPCQPPSGGCVLKPLA